MITAETGFLVPQGDAAALAKAMEELIGDPERRERMGRAAAERAKAFASKAVLPRFEQAYRDAIESASGRPPA
jgi:glycosyltransferase involved in cell wall biosynthesis